MLAVVIVHQTNQERLPSVREAHSAWLRKQAEAGTLLFAGRRTSAAGGVFVLQGSSKEELAALCATDPFATAGVANHEVIDFEPGYGSLLGTLEGAPRL